MRCTRRDVRPDVSSLCNGPDVYTLCNGPDVYTLCNGRTFIHYATAGRLYNCTPQLRRRPAGRLYQSHQSQQPTQIPSRVRPFTFNQILRGPAKNYLSSVLTSFRSDIDNPVGIFDNIKIMFNNDNRVMFVH